MRRLIGLSNPRPSRNVARMNNIPSIDKMDVTRSVTASALSWLGLNDTDILKGGFSLIETIGEMA